VNECNETLVSLIYLIDLTKKNWSKPNHDMVNLAIEGIIIKSLIMLDLRFAFYQTLWKKRIITMIWFSLARGTWSNLWLCFTWNLHCIKPYEKKDHNHDQALWERVITMIKPYQALWKRVITMIKPYQARSKKHHNHGMVYLVIGTWSNLWLLCLTWNLHSIKPYEKGY
jgi:hypothetical protein